MISSHILDTHLGKPAIDVVIKLFDAQEQLIAESKTNNDGRVADFNLSEIQTGQYHLVFYTADCFLALLPKMLKTCHLYKNPYIFREELA